MHYDCELGELSLEKDGIDNCYDCVAFVNIIRNYLNITNSKKEIKKLINEIQYEISFHKFNIKSQTEWYFLEHAEKLRRLLWDPCTDLNCNVCPSGFGKYKKTARSKATLENEAKYIDKNEE
jgi:hypothetical protein